MLSFQIKKQIIVFFLPSSVIVTDPYAVREQKNCDTRWKVKGNRKVLIFGNSVLKKKMDGSTYTRLEDKILRLNNLAFHSNTTKILHKEAGLFFFFFKNQTYSFSVLKHICVCWQTSTGNCLQVFACRKSLKFSASNGSFLSSKN